MIETDEENNGTLHIRPARSGTITKLQIPFEIFGSGPIRLLFLPGMSLSRKMWMNQIAHFASSLDFTVLVIDNRGNGQVENRKFQKYSTAAMARDVSRVLSELGWVEKKSVHVCGLSMGGMITLQVALLIPERIASICLTSTCARWRPPKLSTADVSDVIRLGITSSEKVKSQATIDICFPRKHLKAHDARFPDYPTNRERYMAHTDLLMSPSQKKYWFVAQANAVVIHNVSNAELVEIGKTIQFVNIVVGNKDKLINPDCATTMATYIGCKVRMFPEHGHIIPWQSPEEFNKELESWTRQAAGYWTTYHNPPGTPPQVSSEVLTAGEELTSLPKGDKQVAASNQVFDTAEDLPRTLILQGLRTETADQKTPPGTLSAPDQATIASNRETTAT